ncbi:MAG: SPOR domain-containing protein [Bryobacteraceae bacterium]
MLRTNDRESEILLGNKQLLGIFFAVALLLGVAFYGGYMVGRGSSATKAATVSDTVGAVPPSSPSAPGETHTIPGESNGSAEENQSSGERQSVIKSNPGSHELAGSASADVPLGSRKTKSGSAHEAKVPAAADVDGEASGSYLPKPGSQYLQVVAIARSEAEGLADVLHKKGFPAHAVPKPGNSAVYRVIVGPIRDAGDLSSTRDALRKTGFREVIVQRY